MSSSQLMGSVSSLKTGVGLELSNSIQKILAALKINWLQNYNQALEKAALTSGSPSQGAQLVMAFFTGSDWCPYCQALSSEVFNKLDFHLWFNSRLMVPLLVDYPHTTAQPDDIKTQMLRSCNNTTSQVSDGRGHQGNCWILSTEWSLRHYGYGGGASCRLRTRLRRSVLDCEFFGSGPHPVNVSVHSSAAIGA